MILRPDRGLGPRENHLPSQLMRLQQLLKLCEPTRGYRAVHYHAEPTVDPVKPSMLRHPPQELSRVSAETRKGAQDPNAWFGHAIGQQPKSVKTRRAAVSTPLG